MKITSDIMKKTKEVFKTMINWKVIALGLSGLASAISLASSVVEDKRRQQQVREEVREALAEERAREEEA